MFYYYNLKCEDSVALWYKHMLTLQVVLRHLNCNPSEPLNPWRVLHMFLYPRPVARSSVCVRARSSLCADVTGLHISRCCLNDARIQWQRGVEWSRSNVWFNICGTEDCIKGRKFHGAAGWWRAGAPKNFNGPAAYNCDAAAKLFAVPLSAAARLNQNTNHMNRKYSVTSICAFLFPVCVFFSSVFNLSLFFFLLPSFCSFFLISSVFLYFLSSLRFVVLSPSFCRLSNISWMHR
jgi:hypothetical protein